MKKILYLLSMITLMAIFINCNRYNVIHFGTPKSDDFYHLVDTTLFQSDTIPYIDAGSNPDYAPSYIENYNKAVVSSKETAVRIAEAIWFEKYGKSSIIVQRPYQVYLKDSIWVVYGSFNYPPGTKGGTAYIEINRFDGRIIRLFHGE